MIAVRRADASDAASILELREALSRWLMGRGIDQWRPGEVGLDDVRSWLSDGRMYVATDAGRIVGAVRVAWADDQVWGAGPPVAGYVHALMASRDSAESGVGARLLAHAETVIRRSGRPLVRLDCQRDNEGLRAYYAGRGYAEVGEHVPLPGADRAPVVLLEKRLSEPVSSPGS